MSQEYDTLLNDDTIPIQAAKKSEKKKSSSGPLVFLCVIALAGAGFFGYQAYTLKAQIAQDSNNKVELEESIITKDEKITELEQQVTQLDGQVALKDSLLESREGFLEAVEQASLVLTAGEGKVDTEPLRNVIYQAQDIVVAEKSSKDVIDNAKATVIVYKDATLAAINLYDQIASQNSQPAPTEPINEANVDLSNARAALDEVGGNWVTLGSSNIVCNNASAIACATPGNVNVASHVAENSKDWWIGPMTHEYAHQIQYQNWESLMASSLAIQLFGEGDRMIENMADCMTAVKVPGYIGPYQPSCSQEQLTYSSSAWSGIF